jgi:hypothetical protein
MNTTKRYSSEVRERAVRMGLEQEEEYLSRWAAIESDMQTMRVPSKSRREHGLDRVPAPAALLPTGANAPPGHRAGVGRVHVEDRDQTGKVSYTNIDGLISSATSEMLSTGSPASCA